MKLTEVCFAGAGALGVILAPTILWARRRRIGRGEVIDPRAAVRGSERSMRSA